MYTASVWQYGTRVAPVLTVCSLLLLLVLALGPTTLRGTQHAEFHERATIWQWLMSCYLCLLSLLSVAFPARALYAINHVIDQIKATHSEIGVRPTNSPHNRPLQEVRCHRATDTIFVIVIPAYQEDPETLQETLRVLAGHKQARWKYHIYLAMEEREANVAHKARNLINCFQSSFGRITYCVHPQGLPGEVPGKSSNQSWAVKQASQFYNDFQKRDMIVTVMDADTHLFSQYFDRIAQLHASHPQSRHQTIYMPPLVFDRNISEVPLLVRMADVLWAGAGISSMYAGSQVCIPTSVYSLPMVLVDYVGGWDVNACAIGEDMHMYLKCFFALSGNLKARVIFAPASQCNICSPEPGVLGYVDCLRLRYQQALRHMWGALDTGFAIRQFVHTIQRSRKRPGSPTRRNPKAALPFDSMSIHKTNIAILFYRMFEAHLLPTHLGLTLAIASYCSSCVPRSSIPQVLQAALDLSGWCQAVGYALMMFFFYRYEQYHQQCVRMRRSEIRALDPTTPMKNSSMHSGIFLYAGVAEAGFFPIGGMLYGILPALQAMVSHIFTERLTYVVSLKAIRKPLGTLQNVNGDVKNVVPLANGQST